MLLKIKLVLKQMRYMYNDQRVEKWCDEGDRIQDEDKLKKFILANARKHTNPEMERVAFAVMGNRWDEVFSPGFELSLDAGEQDLLK